jgi:hypothetical protein
MSPRTALATVDTSHLTDAERGEAMARLQGCGAATPCGQRVAHVVKHARDAMKRAR